MTNFLIEALTWGICCGIIAAAYIDIVGEEEFFNPWWQIGAKYENRWFFKPVWGCSHCCGGQLALWSYLLLSKIPVIVALMRLDSGLFSKWYVFLYGAGTGLFGLIIAISTAILFAKVLSWIIQKVLK